MGMVSPLGIGVEATWKGLLEGRGGIRPVSFFDASPLRSRIAGEVEGFDPEAFGIDFKLAKRCDRFTQFALATTHEALRHARLEITPSISDRVGVIIGS